MGEVFFRSEFANMGVEMDAGTARLYHIIPEISMGEVFFHSEFANMGVEMDAGSALDPRAF